MTTLSLERVCHDSQVQEFKFPNVVLTHRSQLTRTIFQQLYQDSDEQGFFELNANALAKKLGLSERKIYYALKFLQKVNLVYCKIRRLGRGKRSLYKLNWKKSAQTVVKNNNIKPYKYDRQTPVTKAHLESSPWNQRMRAFRLLLESSWLLPTEQQLCAAMIGRKIKNRSRQFALRLYESLANLLPRIDVPNWVETKRQLCAWFMATLNKISGVSR